MINRDRALQTGTKQIHDSVRSGNCYQLLKHTFRQQLPHVVQRGVRCVSRLISFHVGIVGWDEWWRHRRAVCGRGVARERRQALVWSRL